MRSTRIASTGGISPLAAVALGARAAGDEHTIKLTVASSQSTSLAWIGTMHTLVVPEVNDGMTDAWFAIYGANLQLDANGAVELVIDAQTVRDTYYALCEAEGHPRPNTIENRGV